MNRHQPLPPPRRFAALSVGGTVVLATGCWGAALLAPREMSLAVAALALVSGIVVRRPWIAVCGLWLVVGGLAGRSVAALERPVPPSIDGVATVVGDPESFATATRVELSLGGRRYQGWGRGAAASAIRRSNVGERWWVSLEPRPVDAGNRYLRSRHIAGVGTIGQAHRVDSGALPFRIANRLRAMIDVSARTLSARDAALLRGFTTGDDRGQPPEVVVDFRRAGLTHLLAVSGQNVAFVLAMAEPLVRRLGPRTRVAALAVLLGQFAVLTRWEPSVLRAVVLAGLVIVVPDRSAGAATRRLAVAVTVLLLVDPLLAWSVGFQLSVAASAGIAWWSVPFERRLVGPRSLRRALATTLAAQLAVLPVQVGVFGQLGLVSVPANLLAGPAAGPVMVWGLLAGLVGGWVGEPVAAALHAPTRLLVGWVAGVARLASTVGGPVLDVRSAVCGALGCAAIVTIGHRRLRSRTVMCLAMGSVVAAAALVPQSAPRLDDRHLWVEQIPAAGVVVAADRPSPLWALDTLLQADVRRIDVLIVRSRTSESVELVRTLSARLSVGEVWAPVGFPVDRRGTSPVPVSEVVDQRTIDGLRVEARGTRLDVERR